LDQLDATLVQLISGGQSILLDPGEKLCPFGQVSWRHSETRGIGESQQGAGIVTTPAQSYRENTTSRNADITVGPHGEVKGSLRVEMAGQEALRWRQEALQVDPEELKKRFDQELEKVVPEGVEAHVDHFEALDKPDGSLFAVATITGALGTVTAKRIMLPGFFFETRVRQPFVNEEKREVPVDMHYGDTVSSSVSYLLPDGVTVEGVPKYADLSWETRASYTAEARSTPGQIVISSTLAKAFAEVKPDAYQDLRGFYQQVGAAEQQQIVLSNDSSAAGKGN
jgi:hypothetical protein